MSIQDWDPDRTGLPGDAVFEAVVRDIQTAFEKKTLGRAGRRLNTYWSLSGSYPKMAGYR